jgi:hypothetical protein
MKAEAPSHDRCVACLVVWFLLIQLAAVLSSGLASISYPQPKDMLSFVLIPIGAFHAAKYARTGVIFTTFGSLASFVFWFHYLFNSKRAVWADDVDYRDMIIRACMVTIVCAVVCRLAAVCRHRWETKRRYPPGHCQECGYNLTGNVSGVCPECGAQISTS